MKLLHRVKVTSNNLFWQRDDLVLHCAHFVVSPTLIEPLHGHTYLIRIEAKGSKNESDVVIDFLDLKPIVKEIIGEISHTVLIPLKNPMLEVEVGNENISLKVEGTKKKYSFPKNTVTLLPIKNSTVECISEYISGIVTKAILEKYHNLEQLKVSVGEYSKSVATAIDIY